MTTWNIGIDESGVFTYYNTKGKHSFVCAAITQESPEELNEKFANLFYMMKGDGVQDPCEKLGFFHSMERKEDEKTTIFENFKNDVCKVVVSRGRPLVLGNPQHWWLSAVMSVIRHVMNLDDIKENDSLTIHLGTKAKNFLGIPVSDGLSEDLDIDWLDYHKLLRNDLLKWIKSINTKKLIIDFQCRTAKRSPLVTLADLSVGMRLMDFTQKTTYLNEKITFVNCDDAAMMAGMQNVTVVDRCVELLNSGYVVESLQLWMRTFFAKENIPFKLFSEIFDNAFAAKNDYANVWKAVLDTCEYALDNRGDFPQLIDRVFKLVPELEKEYARIEGLDNEQRAELGVDIYLLINIWRVLEKVSSHHGDTDCKVLEYVDHFWESDCRKIGSTLDRWKFYLQTKLICAQIPFNGYDFASVSDLMEPLLDCHEKLCSLPFPFENPAVDDNLAELLGTCGQAAAFQDDLDEAINCFKEDYESCSAYWKTMPASFMVTVLHRMRDFDAACDWFQKQTCGISFEDFSKNLSSTSDLWQMVNYFKILVLAQMQKKTVELNIPDLESWNIQNTYPWPLVIKWAALSLMLSGQDERGVRLLEVTHKLLQKDGFTVKTLSLPILQMLYCGTKDEQYGTAYKKLLEQLMASCKTFKAYVENHSESFALDKDKDLWDAAMILPFNYA